MIDVLGGVIVAASVALFAVLVVDQGAILPNRTGSVLDAVWLPLLASAIGGLVPVVLSSEAAAAHRNVCRLAVGVATLALSVTGLLLLLIHGSR